MLQSEVRQLVVLDDLKDRLEMLESDIAPGSYAKPITSGIENVAANILSRDGVNYQGCFTVFPLGPLEGKVTDLDKSFLHFVIEFNFALKVESYGINAELTNVSTDKTFYLAVGPRDTSSLFNQLQLMIDNNVIWDSTYHRTESAICLASMPSSIVEYSPMYATIDKLLNNQRTPMKIIQVTIPSGSNTVTSQFTLSYDFTIDLNRLCVPLSNISYITSNMGNLRIKCFLNDVDKCFYYMVLPNGFGFYHTATANQVISNTRDSAYVSLDPILWGEGMNVIDKVDYTDMLTGTNATAINAADAQPFFKFTFNKRLTGTTTGINFMTCQIAEIYQATFDLDDKSYDELCAYFEQQGHVVIPIEELATSAFNIGSITPNTNTNIPSTLIANIPGNNITKIVISDVLQANQTAIINPYISSFQVLLDGRPLNSIPYNKLDDRAITDFSMGMLDTDTEEINKDYVYSMSFPPLISKTGGNVTREATQYLYDGCLGTILTMNNYNNLAFSNRYIKNTPLCPLVFDTAVQGSFHTGMCILEKSRNAALIQLRGTYASQTNEAEYGKYGQNHYPTIPSLRTNANQFLISALCDSCIMLRYDASRRTCTSGWKSWAKPFIGVSE